METTEFTSLLPDIQAAAELFPGCTCCAAHEAEAYRGVRLYRPGMALQKDILYIIRTEDDFPTDDYAYISAAPIKGLANHICCPDEPWDRMLDKLLELFARFREQEMRINELVYRGEGIQQLCELAAALLENPVYIHDDWFMMIARSEQVDQIIAPEYVMTSTKGFLPRVIIDDFRDDSDYLETYSFRTAQVWSSGTDAPDCLYVNLWDGSIYRGRLLVIQSGRSFCRADFLLAQVLTQRVIYLLHRKQFDSSHASRSMDDCMLMLLQGGQPDPADLTRLLNMLHWSKTDKLLCIRIQSQQPAVTALDAHVLHSDLFRCFPTGYVMLLDNQQFVILNLTRTPLTLSALRHTLSPLCRDYCLYVGISSPVMGIADLHLGHYQSDAALNYAFQMHNEKWIVAFSECALDHILNHPDSPLQPWHLVSPELHILKEYDAQKGTPYFETLREYLLAERDIPKTAERLIIHRTTLLYRLKKIQSLLSVNLDDPWQRLYLILSLWIMEKERI